MLHEVSFKSFNERDTVYGWIYVPACEPKGIVQLIHGFGEHSRRYFHLIVRLMEAGYIVAADDHVGHGKTALENNTWGDWGNQGFHTIMEDEHQLKALVSELYPNLPYFLYGHSMGSMIARDFMTKYGEELTGATICGTCIEARGFFYYVRNIVCDISGISTKAPCEAPATHGRQVCKGIAGSVLHTFVPDFFQKKT